MVDPFVRILRWPQKSSDANDYKPLRRYGDDTNLAEQVTAKLTASGIEATVCDLFADLDTVIYDTLVAIGAETPPPRSPSSYRNNTGLALSTFRVMLNGLKVILPAPPATFSNSESGKDSPDISAFTSGTCSPFLSSSLMVCSLD
jgi:hypothetical protein